jgi:hypothetical protein
MASVFSHRDDEVIRVGDYVRTISSVGSTALDITSSHRPRESTSRGLPRPPSRSLDKSNINTSIAPNVTQLHHPSSASPSHVDRSAVCDMFKADTSSMDAWWRTMTRGTWLQQSTEAIRVGVVRSVDYRSGHVHVTVWMLGDRCLVEVPKKPVEAYPASRLEKLNVHTFNDICRKRFMHEMGHHLKLRGEGYDESAPFALIAHNNRVISDLIGKIDTTAKLSLKDIKVRRPRGPADLMKRPIPTMVPIEDPLAAARGELQALQESGLVQKGGRRRRYQGQVGSPHKSTHDDDIVQGSTRHVRTPMVGDVPMTHSSAGTPQPQPKRSFFEGAIGDETVTAQRSLRASSALSRPNAAVFATRQTLLPDRFFHDSAVHVSAPGGGRHGKGPQRQAFLTSVHSLDASLSSIPFDQQRPHIPCMVVDVMPGGCMLLRPSNTADPPFTATLAYVDVWQHPAALAALGALRSLEVKVIPVSRDLHGNCVCEIFLKGECLAETLLAEGFASLNVSALDGTSPAMLDGPAVTNAPQPPERLGSLLAVQQRALREMRGVWREVEDTSSTVCNLSHVLGTTHSPPENGGGSEGAAEHLPPLFGAFESSHTFHRQLSERLSNGAS